MKKLTALTLIALIVVVIVCAFMTGWTTKPADIVKVPYPVTYTSETVQIEYVDKPVIVEKIVTQNVSVEVIKEIPVTRTQWRDFQSLEELTSWLDGLSVLWISGKVVDCDEYSEFVWGKAYAEGYRMSEQLVYDGKLLDKVVMDTAGQKLSHIGCLVNIGNKYYYFEPNPLMYRVIYICDRD